MQPGDQRLALRTLQQERELQDLRAEVLQLRQRLHHGPAPHDLPAAAPHYAAAPPTSSKAAGRPTSAGRPNSRPSGGGEGGAYSPTPLYSSFPVAARELSWQSQQAPNLEAHSAVAFKGKLFVFGGSTGTAINSDMWTFAPDHGRWSRVACTGNLPRGRYSHSCVLYRSSLIIYGGFGPVTGAAKQHGPSSTTSVGTACGLLSSVYAFDLESKVWSEVSSGGHGGGDPCKSHTSVVRGNQMFVFGGVTSVGRTNVVRVFDLDRQTWLPSEEFNPQLVALHQQAVSASSALHAVQPARSEVPAARSGHACVVVNSITVAGGVERPAVMILFGGRLDKYVFANDAFQYDFRTLSWSRMYCGGEAPAPRSDHVAAAYREHVIVFGGYSLDASPPMHLGPTGAGAGSASGNGTVAAAANIKTFFSDVFTLNTVSQTWQRVDIIGNPSRPIGICSCTGTVVETSDGHVGVMLVGGYGRLPSSPAPVERALLDDDVILASVATDTLAQYGATSDVWFMAITKADQRRSPSPSSRPTSGRPSRPSTARPTSARIPSASRSRSPADGRQRPSPWSINTCRATTTRVFGDAPTGPSPRPPAPIRRSEYEIEQIKRRLAYEDVEKKKHRLEELSRKFIKEEEPRRFTLEEQNESVDRLYYQQNEWKADKAKQLEQKWIKVEEPKKIDAVTVDELVERLFQTPHRPEPPRPESAKSAPEKVSETVHRLYYVSKELDKQREAELRKRFLFESSGKHISASQVSDLLGRLYTAGSTPPRGGPSPRRR